ncbi:MAG: sugar phosphate isomerase/epimerase family protein [Verrucomicrobiota bacterium]
MVLSWSSPESGSTSSTRTIGARSSLEAFDLAKEIGLSSIQASFDPTLGLDELDLKEERHREAILEKAESTGVAIASTAMGILNGQPFKEVPEAVGWVKEGIAVTEALGETVMLLAFFGKNDLKGDAEGTAETIRRLKEVAPVAEEKGIVLGLETTLDIDEHLHIIESVGSKAVQVYYDLGNSHGNGYDIASEIRQLGSDLICEVHCKDKGGWLFGPGEVPFAEATKALIEIGYDSWLILEGGTAEGMEKLETLQKNAEFLREIGLATA